MSCRAQRVGDALILENSMLRREFAWNNGALATRLILDKKNFRRWDMPAEEPDFLLPGEETAATDARLETREAKATAISAACTEVSVTFRLAALEVRRVYRLYPDCPAMACDTFLRGKARQSSWLRADNGEEALANPRNPPPGPVLDRWVFGRTHLRCESVQFFDVTDRRNNLVLPRTFIPYRFPCPVQGNILAAAETVGPAGFFLLKEAPCSDMQLHPPVCDFAVGRGAILIVGLGVEPADLDEQEWTRGYTAVLGVAAADETARLLALRRYQQARRAARPGCDDTILLNTWGDRGGAARISEDFAKAELEAGARLGITHFQLDDGWQAGNFSEPGRPEEPRTAGFWKVHPERFPHGLASVATRARQLGIELCLWFAPEPARSYANWYDNADTLIRLWQDYGIRDFKIDGMDVPDKTAERNLFSLFDTVLHATNGEAFFNLDVTAGRRFGYHYATEYGNLFVENRYTDWSNYYPHWTLRNLWHLARWVPPEILQIEFLNHWRRQDQYPEDDPFAPSNVPFDYGFAVAMMAQPLAWMEASALPEDAFPIAPLIQAYRRHQPAIHRGAILPIGEEPSGTGWTGFQSLQAEGTGYLLAFRERNERERARVRIHPPGARQLDCRLVLGNGADFLAEVADDGTIECALPDPFSFALYQYRPRR